MKKSLIAAGAASVALAAMPVLGTFADVIDVVQITISSSCSVGSDTSSPAGTGKTMTANMINGDVKEFSNAQGADAAGGDIYVTCNSSSGWNITAVGYSSDTEGTTTMPATTGTGTAIPTGTDHLDGSASQWAFKLVDDGTGATLVPTNWTAIPSEATKVASKTGAISAGHIRTAYKVSTSPTQEAATYTGKVKYVVSAGVGQ